MSCPMMCTMYVSIESENGIADYACAHRIPGHQAAQIDARTTVYMQAYAPLSDLIYESFLYYNSLLLLLIVFGMIFDKFAHSSLPDPSSVFLPRVVFSLKIGR